MRRWQWMKILTAALMLLVAGGCLIAAGAFGGYLEERGLDDADRIASVVGMVLAGIGLLLGLASLVVAVVALRKREERVPGPPPGASSAQLAIVAEMPRQLPPDVGYFTGRASALARLHETLENRGPAPAVCVIDGMPGVGKTALLTHWAHRVAGEFSDGQIYLNVQEYSAGADRLSVSAALDLLLSALSQSDEEPPRSVESKVARYRTLTAGRQLLLLIDNVADEDYVRQLLPASTRSLTLVASRNRLRGLISDGATGIGLSPLPVGDARHYLSRRLGERRIEADAGVIDIVELCAGLPLALSLVAARALENPGFPLSALAQEMRELTILAVYSPDAPGTNLRSVLSWSYRKLDAQSSRVFRLLGMCPATEFSQAAVATVAGVPLGAAQRSLDVLSRLHLLEEVQPRRYAFHDILRDYAAELSSTETDGLPSRREVELHLLHHLLHSARRAGSLLHFLLPIEGLPAAPAGVTVARLASFDDAQLWFSTERATLVAMIRHCHRRGQDELTWWLTWMTSQFLLRSCRWGELLETQNLALAAAARTGNRTWSAGAYRLLGSMMTSTNNFREASSYFKKALTLFRGNPAGSAFTHIAVCRMYEFQQDYTKALQHARKTQRLYHEAGDASGEAIASNSVGWYLALQGDLTRARRICQEALQRLEELGDRHGRAHTLDSLGYIARQLEQDDEALRWYELSRAGFIEIDEPLGIADCAAEIGDIHLSLGAVAEARASWEEALGIYTKLKLAQADAIRSKLAQPPARP